MENKLDQFGKTLILEVRDLTIKEFIQIKEGKMKSDNALRLNKLRSSLNQEQKKILDIFVNEFIDRTIHNLLWLFERSNDFTIGDKIKIEKDCDIADESDGLTGELYSEKGWIDLYSKFS